MANKVEDFDFVRDDGIDCLAFYMLLGELPAKGDNVGHVGYPCRIEGFGCLSAFSGHDLAQAGLKMVQYAFDGVVGIPDVLFVEFFNVLFAPRR